MKIKTYSEEETIEFGRQFAKRLKKGDVLAFYGELGSGKTTLIKGIVEGLSYKKPIKSPSFIIVAVYPSEIPIYHIDLYRLNNIKEIDNIGLLEYIYGDGISLIEWAEKIEELLPKKRINIKISIISEKEREIEIEEF
ncbi:MAG: tRNA (adenosine(37)-N6)-threonylcarbamoyltransferase complex ATPase subunit type 1 TsaE [candidate division WOR-3 bacterium]|nr:tRNA (adenosine(37)-N6)-threonylcarbamoyltransferase complex ATPase subunit type 1 TsaE [candidate division WOR-3 bacterium]MCX7836335.1 tRNA (adenosine(37)-N6)-threonylcarbamoyltransferase complex ATPase subunit type 1 TsaE [candidate division WOR-3 bacterium]MDW8113560.1 tRNA (adenosine(37)-N6)-threonylcarbamoyltransferase complex ATPase subunit type 1 TsaE [candidate division WOR-3 bacterium]